MESSIRRRFAPRFRARCYRATRVEKEIDGTTQSLYDSRDRIRTCVGRLLQKVMLRLVIRTRFRVNTYHADTEIR